MRDALLILFIKLPLWEHLKENKWANGLDPTLLRKFWSELVIVWKELYLTRLNLFHTNFRFRKLAIYDKWNNIVVHIALDNLLVTNEVSTY